MCSFLSRKANVELSLGPRIHYRANHFPTKLNGRELEAKKQKKKKKREGPAYLSPSILGPRRIGAWCVKTPHGSGPMTAPMKVALSTYSSS